MGIIRYNKKLERNIAMELVRVTEAAALSAARYLGRGDHVRLERLVAGAIKNWSTRLPWTQCATY